jgi:uncharacterized protein (UPF0264 family)
MAHGAHRGASRERSGADHAMTGVLASVQSVDEAELALATGVDIIDLKDPQSGALGALPAHVIRDTVARIAGARTVSATAGDLPMDATLIAGAVRKVAGLGVDVVKIGLHDGPGLARCLAALGTVAARGVQIVAVFFADRAFDPAFVERVADHALAGIMLDTADKRAGTLRDCVDDGPLALFVERARASGLLCGLAGSLRASDIPALAALAPDYLGFRGALCTDGRTGALDRARVRTICAAVRAQAATSAAMATAGAQRAAHSRTSAVASIRVAKST